MITERLKQATLPAHQQLEKWMVYRIKSIDSIEQYTHLLELFIGFYQPLEYHTQPYLQEVVPDLDERRKSHLLWKDIGSLEVEVSCLSLCGRLPAFSNTAQALGALYVMEGSTLGGAIIAKMVKGKITHLPDTSLQFFHGYGAQTMDKWARFKQCMNGYATSEEQGQAVIEGASDTFSFFYEWLRSN